jgi:hypothetical protein
VRAAIPQTSPLAKAEFTTIRQRLIKIGARVIEHPQATIADWSSLPPWGNPRGMRGGAVMRGPVRAGSSAGRRDHPGKLPSRQAAVVAGMGPKPASPAAKNRKTFAASADMQRRPR